jgi:hypothetical protein
MTRLEDVCGSDLSAATLDELRERCRDFGQAFELSALDAGLVGVFALVGLLWLLLLRVRQGASTGVTIGNTIEGLAYGAIGAFAGSGFGLFVAELVPPGLLGATLVVVAIVSFVFVVLGVVNGDGDAGGKVAAVIFGALLAAVPVTVAGVAFTIPGDGAAGDDYETYLNVAPLAFGALGAVDGIVAAVFRGPHWAAGWLLVFLNSSWGFLGNVLGLATHLASYPCWARRGDVVRDNRIAYTLYRRGLTLKEEAGGRYAFTQGWVMSCDQPGDVQRHEALHVGQHFVGGPIYVVSHGIWAGIGGVIGLFAGPAKGLSIADGITKMSYFNNPYEIMAYATHSGARQDGDTLIIPSPWSYLLMVGWILGAVGVFVLLLAAWTG